MKKYLKAFVIFARDCYFDDQGYWMAILMDQILLLIASVGITNKLGMTYFSYSWQFGPYFVPYTLLGLPGLLACIKWMMIVVEKVDDYDLDTLLERCGIKIN